MAKEGQKKPDPVERDEFHRLISSMKTQQLRNLWSLAVYTGLRHGELCALAWEDIDLKKWTLNVSRNLTKKGDFIKAGLRLCKAYQSRHTYVCWSLSAGANPNVIASQIGHADAQMVYQVYGAWKAENDDAQLSLMNSRLNEFAPLMPERRTG